MRRSGRNGFTAPWSEEETARLVEVFPSAFDQELTRLLPNRTHKAIRERAKLLGLRHSPRRPTFVRGYDDPVEGGYVSGLTDGEGWFMVSLRKVNGQVANYNPKFGITLRADDRGILEWLRRYFDCGRLSVVQKRGYSPQLAFCVASAYDICRAVLPHFDRFPLRAKKARDLSIWRQMVAITADNFRRPWSDETRAKMADLYTQLRAIRAYRAEPADWPVVSDQFSVG